MTSTVVSGTITSPVLVGNFSNPVSYKTEDFLKMAKDRLLQERDRGFFLGELVMYSYGGSSEDDKAIATFVEENLHLIGGEERPEDLCSFAIGRNARGSDYKLDLNLHVVYFLLKKFPTWTDRNGAFIMQTFLEHLTGKEHGPNPYLHEYVNPLQE